MPGTASGSRRPIGTATSCLAGTTSRSSSPMASEFKSISLGRSGNPRRHVPSRVTQPLADGSSRKG